MSLKNHIEERVVALTDNPISIQKRMTLCLWDASIGSIQENIKYCLSEMDSCIFDVYKENFAELLEQQIQIQKNIYKNKIKEGLLSSFMEIYVLIMISFENRKFLKEMNEIINGLFESMFHNCIMEYYVLIQEDTVREKIFEDNIGNQIYYLSDSFASVDTLLNNAKYDMVLFSTFIRNNCFRNSHIFVLKIEECNAVREHLCYKSLCEVEKQISKRQNDGIHQEIKDQLFSNQWKKEILDEVPKIEWLPLIGINELIKKLSDMSSEKTHAYLKRLLSYLKKVENKSDNLSVKEAINILYGSSRNEIRTERIRTLLKNGIILELCRSYLKIMDADILNIIYQRCSVYDILNSLQSLLFEYKEEVWKQVQDTEIKIEESLQKSFVANELSTGSIWNSLKGYRSVYDDFCDKYVEYCWWETLIRYCDDCKTEAQKKYKEFIEVRNILNNSLISKDINFMEHTMSFYEDRTEWSITSVKELENRINNFISNSFFDASDLKKIIKWRDRLFINQHDLHVDIRFHPFVIMIVSENADITESTVEELVRTREVSFSWKLFKANHVSLKNTYQMRVYNVINNEEYG